MRAQRVLIAFCFPVCLFGQDPVEFGQDVRPEIEELLAEFTLELANAEFLMQEGWLREGRLNEEFMVSFVPNLEADPEYKLNHLQGVRELEAVELLLRSDLSQLPMEREVGELLARADDAALYLLSKGGEASRVVTTAYEASADGSVPTIATASMSEQVRDSYLGPAIRQLAFNQVVDQADLGARTALDISVMNEISRLAGGLVSIHQATSRLSLGLDTQKGVGFLWKGRVLTAAHVPLDWAQDADGGFDSEQLFLVFPDARGNFDPQGPLVAGVSAAGERGPRFLVEWDVAVLTADVDGVLPDAPLRRHLASRLELDYSVGLKDVDLRRGNVFGLTARASRGGLRSSVIQGGPLIFASVSDVPPEGHWDLASAEFKRAFRFEILARMFDSRLWEFGGRLDDLPQLAYRTLIGSSASGPSYRGSEPIGAGPQRRRFGFVPSSTAIRTALAQGQDSTDSVPPSPGWVEVFGSDLETKAGMSGSPIFLFKGGKPVLAGIHVAGDEGEVTRTLLPSSSDIALAVPFHRVKPHLLLD